VTDNQNGSATDKQDGSATAIGGLIFSAAKAAQDGINRVKGAKITDDATWRIRWEPRITFGGGPGEKPGYYVLRNISNAAKYSVSAEAPSGARNTWPAIYEQDSEKLDSPYEPRSESDELKPFVVRWRAGQGRFSRVRKSKVWGK
jgi:hypothetical protein